MVRGMSLVIRTRGDHQVPPPHPCVGWWRKAEGSKREDGVEGGTLVFVYLCVFDVSTQTTGSENSSTPWHIVNSCCV